MTRRAGAIAGRLLAILSGTETPTDVAAVLTWFFEHPEHLRARFGGGHGDVTSERSEAHVAVANLLAAPPLPSTVDEHGLSENSLGWRRFMDQVFASFCASRGRIATSTAGDETAEEGGDEATLESPPQIAGGMAAFDHLFDLLLGANDGHRDLGLALQISQYVCDRLEPTEAVVEGYLTRLLSTMSSSSAPESDRTGLAAAVLVSAAKQRQGVNELAMLRAARRRLLRLGVEIADDVPDMGTVRGFARILTPDIDAVALWSAIREVTTFQEEVKLYRLAAPGPLAPTDFPALATRPEWPKLADTQRKGIYFVSKNANGCPRHHMKLPTSEASLLQTIGVGRALNCCEAILLCEEL